MGGWIVQSGCFRWRTSSIIQFTFPAQTKSQGSSWLLSGHFFVTSVQGLSTQHAHVCCLFLFSRGCQSSTTRALFWGPHFPLIVSTGCYLYRTLTFGLYGEALHSLTSRALTLGENHGSFQPPGYFRLPGSGIDKLICQTEADTNEQPVVPKSTGAST